MASFSYGANRNQVFRVEDIVVGTQAVSTYDVELRVNKASSLTKREILDIIGVFVRRLEDSRFQDAASI